MHTSFIFARLRKLLRASLVSWRDIVCPCRWLSTAPSPLRLSLAPNCLGLALQFWALLSLSAAFRLVSVLVFRCNCRAWCLGLESEVPFHPCSLAPPFSSTKEFPVGWGPLAGLPWIPPPHARALPGSTNFVGTNAQAHLLVMSLNYSYYTYYRYYTYYTYCTFYTYYSYHTYYCYYSYYTYDSYCSY